ncbi:MAG: putative regulatory protein Ada, partial [Rickettsiaceae bacterium]|nr:putative regulatory protein Ada [Rickettsiaceae bacterium]
MQTISDQIKKEYYKALLDKNSNYENIFFVGVKTTGVFCRPSCPARKPKYENCEFFQTAQQALIASFRPCIRCKPLSHPNHVSNLVKKLLDAIESAPEKRWKNSDLEELSVDCSTARRQFKKRFGMTFIEYARARRMGIAMKYIKHGDPIIYAQLEAGYESSSGFRDAFTKIMGALPSQSKNKYNVLKASWLDTPLGPMVAISDEKLLYLLEFADRRGLEREIECLRKKTNSAIIPGRTIPIESIEQELKLYFSGQLRKFSTPLFLLGSAFQKLAWQALIEIPYGETRSYIEQAKIINLPS